MIYIIFCIPSVAFCNKIFVYNLKANVGFLDEILELKFLKSDHYIFQYLVQEYLPGLWNSLINLLTFLIIDKLSLFRNYTEYISKEKFIMRVSFFYLTLNIIFVPMFSYSVS